MLYIVHCTYMAWIQHPVFRTKMNARSDVTYVLSVVLTYITLLAWIEKDAIAIILVLLQVEYLLQGNINRNILPDNVCEKWGNEDISSKIKNVRTVDGKTYFFFIIFESPKQHITLFVPEQNDNHSSGQRDISCM